MLTSHKITGMKITFKENGDVWYEISVSKFDLEIFNHIVDYPINKIDIDDIESIYPVYISELSNGKTLIEIKGSPSEINLKYVKKKFLKKEIINDDKVVLKYCENIKIDIDESHSWFCLKIHSPFSYISAIRKLSTAKFNKYSYEPRDLTQITLKQSGIMQIDWYLEIMEDKKLQNLEEVQQQTKCIHKLSRFCGNYRQYNWIDDHYEQLINSNLLTISELLLRTPIKEILYGSCFYLSAGADITPIVALQDKVQTFIFCDEYGDYPNSKDSINEFWLIIEDKLQKQDFNIIQTKAIDKSFLKIRDFRFYDGRSYELKKAFVGLWEKGKKLYCLLYLNWDNSMAFQRLYVENRIVPKAICELLPDGGSLGKYSWIKIPYKFRMPEYLIGHKYSIGKPEEYELITDDIKYFGDFGATYGNAGSSNGINLYKRKL